MWAFVGSGASVEAGLPSWSQLIANVLKANAAQASEVAKDKLFNGAMKSEDFPRCLSYIEHAIGRELLQKAVYQEFGLDRDPTAIQRRLANMPFAGYITTNYDGLLMRAIRATGDLGWTAIGNTDAEVPKVAGRASKVIWHIHGGVDLTPDKSRLVLTEEDYEALYLEGSRTLDQLKALLSQHRIVFVGFGLRDREVMRVLRKVGLLTNPARPLYAFMPLAGRENEGERRELLRRYNIDVVPYEYDGRSHQQLRGLLDVYGSLVLPRLVRLRRPAREQPSYDPETTGLFLYNEFALKAQPVAADVVSALLRSRVLSLINFRQALTKGELIGDLGAIAALLGKHADQERIDRQLSIVLAALEADGLVAANESANGARFSLTDNGRTNVSQQAARAQLLADQFSASLSERASRLTAEPMQAKLVSRAAEGFLKSCIERRALGVSLAMDAWAPGQQSYHMVALLQTLPEFMAELRSQAEVIQLSTLVQQVLAEPSQSERAYIGIALQARFGVHLLGSDPDAVAARLKDFSSTLFLVDSTTLIPLLAKGSAGHDAATFLIGRLQELRSIVRTTSLLILEAAEHGRWALEHVDQKTGRITDETMRAALGVGGERSNAFLDGFLTELSRGAATPNLSRYLAMVFSEKEPKTSCSEEDVKRALGKVGIQPIDYAEYYASADSAHRAREQKLQEIQTLREASGTYRHERQVRAEAEALLIVLAARAGKIRVGDVLVESAYFMSNTRIVDDVAGTNTRVTIQPKAALQWLATIVNTAPEELSLLTDSLLWELAERNLSVVNKEQMQATFSPLISASEADRDEQLQHHRALISQQYGEDAVQAFRHADPLDLPIILGSFHAQRAQAAETRLHEAEARRQEAEAKREEAEKTAKKAVSKVAELERYGSRRRDKKRKEVKRKRAAASRPGKSGRKKGHR